MARSGRRVRPPKGRSGGGGERVWWRNGGIWSKSTLQNKDSLRLLIQEGEAILEFIGRIKRFDQKKRRRSRAQSRRGRQKFSIVQGKTKSVKR